MKGVSVSSRSSPRSDCIFCQIVARAAHARIIYETRDIVCFLPTKVEVYGHTLIASKLHYQDIFDVPVKILAAAAAAGRTLALAYRQKFGATGVNILHASGADAQQSVFHYHIHLLPRLPNDGMSAWPQLPHRDFDIKEIHARLKFKQLDCS